MDNTSASKHVLTCMRARTHTLQLSSGSVSKGQTDFNNVKMKLKSVMAECILLVREQLSINITKYHITSL